MSLDDLHAPAWEPLIQSAWQAWAHAYAPYSGFQVGAAIQDAQGRIFPGCNVENASYPVSLCAERTAICAGITQGMRPGDLKALVVATEATVPTPPCGACRQVLAEFAEDMPILLVNRSRRSIFRLQELLPYAFSGLHMALPINPAHKPIE